MWLEPQLMKIVSWILFNLTNTHCLYQMVSSPTRITQSSSSLLDLLITNKPTWVNKVKILPPVACCDHSPVIAEINFTIPVTPICYKRKLS